MWKDFLTWFVKVHKKALVDVAHATIFVFLYIFLICATIVGVVGLVMSPFNDYYSDETLLLTLIYIPSWWWYLILFLIGYFGLMTMYYHDRYGNEAPPEVK